MSLEQELVCFKIINQSLYYLEPFVGAASELGVYRGEEQLYMFRINVVATGLLIFTYSHCD